MAPAALVKEVECFPEAYYVAFDVPLNDWILAHHHAHKLYKVDLAVT